VTVTAWKGGRFENPSIAYGIRIGPENRSRYFQPEWETIIVEIAGGSVVEATLTAGFWQDCPEVRHPAFRDWFKSKRLIPWSARNPPTFELNPVGERRFRLSTPHQ
jgi:hypothetical protein